MKRSKFCVLVSVFAAIAFVLSADAATTTMLVPGLWQQSYNTWNSSSDPSTGGVCVPGALMASSANQSNSYNGVTYVVTAKTTWAYRGYMLMTSGVTYNFVKNYNRYGYITITDTTGVSTAVIAGTTGSEVKYGTYTPTATGLHKIDFRVYGPDSGYGMPTTAPFNDATMLGAGLAWNTNGYSTCTEQNYAGWRKFMNSEDDIFLYTMRTVRHATPGAVEGTGDGSGWESPMSLAEAFAASGNGDEIHLKAGDYTVTNSLAITKMLTVKGGYAGTDASAMAADNLRSVLDGTNNSAVVNLINVTATIGLVSFDRLGFRNAWQKGVSYKADQKTPTWKADFSFVNCHFATNCTVFSSYPAQQPGVGVYLYYRYSSSDTTTRSASTAYFKDCVFEDNCRTIVGTARTDGILGSINVTRFSHLTVENCTFNRNGAAFNITLGSNGYGYSYGSVGGIVASSTPVTITGSRFVANRGSSGNGGTQCGASVNLSGNCGGSALSNCLFVANSSLYNSTTGGALLIGLGSDDQTAEVWGCTFAYNTMPGTTASAGLTVTKGDVKVRNSIFYGNYVYGRTSGYGADVSIRNTAKLDIDYSLLTDDTTESLSCETTDNLTKGDHLVYGDPLFGTTLEAVQSYRTAGTFKYANLADIMAINVHEGGLGTGTSIAIDAGDRNSPYANEPQPNGGRVNLGAYGNTPEASTSSAGQPAIVNDAISVVFNDTTRPTVSFELGGEGDYNATVTIEVSDGPFEGGGTIKDSVILSAQQNGESPKLVGKAVYTPGTTAYVRITISAGGVYISTNLTATVTGTIPAHYGHGGGANVIHVREGADGFGTGANWTDALTSMNDAIAAVNSEKTEIWIAGTLVAYEPPRTFAPPTAFAIRGGFTGVEDSPETRQKGVYATLDGNAFTNNVIVLNNAAGRNVTLERLVISRAKEHGVTKSGAGALEVLNCMFHSNGWDDGATSIYGRGMYLSDGEYVSVSNCEFRGNHKIKAGYYVSCGGAIWAKNISRLYVDDSLFVTNGCNPKSGTGRDLSGNITGAGGVMYLENTPLTARGSRFISNRTAAADGWGGVVMINGAAAPCAFTNCVFAGNQNTYSCIYQSGCTGTAGGAVVLYLANSDVAAVFENCTIAYNLSDGYNLPAGIDVVRGRARVHNSIVAENVKSSICTVGVDIAVWPAGSLDISYTRLSSAGEGSLWCAAAENVVASNLTYGDPMFVTPVADFLSHAHTNGTSYIDYNNAGLLFTSTIDVHLKSKRGYYDNAGALHTAAGVFSDCIDAGDPTSGYGREPTLPFSAGNGKRVNLGAYGNTPEASMSPLSGCMILLM